MRNGTEAQARHADNVVDLNTRRRHFINADATAWAREQHHLKFPLRYLLTVIAGFADKHSNECWPSQEYLADLTHQCERTIRTQMGKLEALGLIEIEHRRNADGERETSLIRLCCDAERYFSPPAKNGLHHRQKTASPPANKVAGKESEESEEQTLVLDLDSEPTAAPPLPSKAACQAEEFKLTPPPLPRVEIEAKFTEFWAAYPRRDGGNPRKTARDKFIAACKRGVDPDLIILAARSFVVTERRNVGTEFIPMAVTWLHQQRWLDYCPISASLDPIEAKRQAALAVSKAYL